ncbi:hypothetical protein AGR7A_Lc120906 [Agrobacterium deltaense NCPPB 1641]|jgi:hypothetical protein|uniref:Uncharacterized protein n=1 Tax=Agrobacterium deltaense NCPPB 1641 TaxID=1183425 RepID=A0A1S7U134_9HYPH|nr:hypothetical protein AGR7A_Lc120906 [Agrobacterium deltaense NCPPB 1641]
MRLAAAPASSPASETFRNKKSYLFSVIYKISSESLKKIDEAIVFLLSNPVKIYPELKTGRQKQYAPPDMQDRFRGKSSKAGSQGRAAGDNGGRRFIRDARSGPDRS